MSNEQVVEKALEQKLVDALEAIEKGAVTVGDTVVKYSPDVANAFLEVIRIDCIGTILTLILVPIFIYFSYIKPLKALIKNEDTDWTNWPGLFAGIGAFISVAIITVWLNMVSVWVFVGAYEPKLYVAKMLVDKVM